MPTSGTNTPERCLTGLHPANSGCACNQRGSCGCRSTSPPCTTCLRCMSCCASVGRCSNCPGQACRTGTNGLGARMQYMGANLEGLTPEQRAQAQCPQCGQCMVCCQCVDCTVGHHRVDRTSVCVTCRTSCRACCGCWQCGGCGNTRRRGNRACRSCRSCQQCCACRPCETCDGERACEWCPTCEVCRAHCRDREAHADDYLDLRPERLRPAPALIPFGKRPLKFWDSSPQQFKKNTLKRHLSVEIEVDKITKTESGRLRAAVKKWSDSIVTDGSLNRVPNAHETNTAPCNGDLFVEHIEELGEAYKELGAGCTTACGLHVHVNCSDLKIYDLRKVILLYAKIERALFELCKPRRATSNFSILCGQNYLDMDPHPENFKRQLLGKFYNNGKIASARPDKQSGLEIKKNKEKKYISVRYRALNLHSFFHRKSIEFRHREGSVDATTIINWAMICGHIIEAANTMSEAQINALPTQGRRALLEILPPELGEWAKKLWRTNELIDWDEIEASTNKPDLPKVPEDEKGADRRAMRKKFRAERRAKARIDEFRLTAIRAIITGTRLPTPGTVTPTPAPQAPA